MPLLAVSSGKKAGGALPAGTLSERPVEERTSRILVVEDEWFIASEIESTLELAGYDVVGIAVTADEAVSLSESQKPDLVLMDIRLRGSRDGVEAALEIAQRLRIRCLFVSAHCDPATQKRAQSAEPVGWLSKPFADHQLLEAVEEGLRAAGR